MVDLFSLSFWFNTRPGLLVQPYLSILFGVILVFMLLAIIFRVVKKNNGKNLYHKFWQGAYSFSVANAIIGAIIGFFTYEMIPLLSARFWLLIWLLVILAWFFFLGRILYLIPKKKIEIAKEKEFKKYLP